MIMWALYAARAEEAAILRVGEDGNPEEAWERWRANGRVSQKGRERRVEREASSVARMGRLRGREATLACRRCIIEVQDLSVTSAVRIMIAADVARIEAIL